MANECNMADFTSSEDDMAVFSDSEFNSVSILSNAENDKYTNTSTSEDDMADDMVNLECFSDKFLKSLMISIDYNISQEVNNFKDFELFDKEFINIVYKRKKIKKLESEDITLKRKNEKLKSVMSKVSNLEYCIDEVKEMIELRKANNKSKLSKVAKYLGLEYLPSKVGTYDQRIVDFLYTYKDYINNRDTTLNNYIKNLKQYTKELDIYKGLYDIRLDKVEKRKRQLNYIIDKEIESLSDDYYYKESGQYAIDKHNEKLAHTKEQHEIIKNIIENYKNKTFTAEDLEKIVNIYNENNKMLDKIELKDLLKPIDIIKYKGKTYEVYSFNLIGTVYNERVQVKNLEGEIKDYQSKYLKLLDVKETNEPIDVIKYKGKTYEVYNKEIEGAEFVNEINTKNIKGENKHYRNKYLKLLDVETKETNEPIDVIKYKGKTYEVYKHEIEGAEFKKELKVKNINNESKHYYNKYIKIINV